MAARNDVRSVSTHEVERLFAQAMLDAGIDTDAAIVADGRLRRFHIKGDKPLSRNGWYVLCSDGVPAGQFGTWRDGGAPHPWRYQHAEETTSEEREEESRRLKQASEARTAEVEKAREQARRWAAKVWGDAVSAAADHPYLLAKSVGAFGIRQHDDRLLVPLRDSAGVLHGLQFIAPDGSKKFGIGTAKAGRYHSIGAKPAHVIAVAEGYATGATVHAATGWPVVVAFDAGNLLPVVRALRAKYPGVLLLICADNDRNTEGNPGLTKARAAVAEVGGIVVAPAFAADSSGTDWNDHARGYGIDATARQLVGVLQEACHAK